MHVKIWISHPISAIVELETFLCTFCKVRTGGAFVVEFVVDELCMFVFV